MQVNRIIILLLIILKFNTAGSQNATSKNPLVYRDDCTKKSDKELKVKEIEYLGKNIFSIYLKCVTIEETLSIFENVKVNQIKVQKIDVNHPILSDKYISIIANEPEKVSIDIIKKRFTNKLISLFNIEYEILQ